MKKGFIAAVSMVIGGIAGPAAAGKVSGGIISQTKQMSDKHLALFLMMNQWVKVKQEGKNLSVYFQKYGYKRIAIYGMSYAGETLVDELKNTEIEVSYGIDKNADSIYSNIAICSMEDNLDKVDAVVVTAISFFSEIKQKLSEKVDCPVISLEDILYEV